MPRRMSLDSRERISTLLRENPKAVGPRLGYVSLKYNIPARAMARMCRVSEPTVYRWFYGEGQPKPAQLERIRRMMALFKRAAEAGDLPVEGTFKQRMQAVRDVITKHKSQPPH